MNIFDKIRQNRSSQGTLLITPTLVFMIGLLIIPLLLTLVISFGRRDPDGGVIYTFTFDNYIRLAGFSSECSAGQKTCFDPLYITILWKSILLALETTVLVISLAYPLSYFIARSHPSRRNTFLMMVLVPLWTNFVIRVYAWMMILRTQGVINGIIGWLFSIFGAHFTPLELSLIHI